VKKTLLVLLLAGAVGGSAYGYYRYNKRTPTPTVNTAAVVRGDVVDTVGATGTLQAVTTVQVGTQVSGTIQNLYADFNSLVKKGQVLARLDPSLFQTQIEQARANLIRAQADLERLRVSLEDAHQKLTRAQELSSRNLIPRTELETAQVNVRSIEAQIRSSEAQVTQAQASLNQNDVNLQHTVIEAPIDGLVISRNVDVGQTVAASMQAPTLFVLAADLTKMQVVANLDESDVGRIRPGQQVIFRVDAYPAEDFTGTVSQVRLQPIVQQNVVTYATVIGVPNPELKLKPGMTANVNIEIARKNNVLRVPNAALRFRPTNEIYAALQQPAPDPEQLRAVPPPAKQAPAEPPPTAAPAKKSGPAPQASTSAPAVPATGEARRGERGGGGRGFGGGQGRGDLPGRLQGLSPEDREQALARFRERGAAGSDGADAGRSQGNRRLADATDTAGSRSNDQGAPDASLAAQNPGATTIDALFAPLPPVESSGRVWLYVGNELKPVRVRIGISDGQASELIEGDLQEGMEVVTSVITGTETRPAAAAGGFPGFGRPAGGFPAGGGGNNNRGGGGRGR
jgi:HlyD family secretion protein